MVVLSGPSQALHFTVTEEISKRLTLKLKALAQQSRWPLGPCEVERHNDHVKKKGLRGPSQRYKAVKGYTSDFTVFTGHQLIGTCYRPRTLERGDLLEDAAIGYPT